MTIKNLSNPLTSTLCKRPTATSLHYKTSILLKFPGRLFFVLCIALGFISPIQASTFWTGSKISFAKANNADWTLAANQDRITSNVWITRADIRGIFNIAPNAETTYNFISSPLGTEWAFGTIAGGVSNLVFKDWQEAVGSSPGSSINKDMVLHLIAEDIYIDLKFLTFNGSGSGGGFSYIRSTPVVSTSAISVPLPSTVFWALGSALCVLMIRLRPGTR